jgi:hypothetical protein
VRVFPEGTALAFESVDCIKIALTNMVRPCLILRAQMEKKQWGKDGFALFFSWDIYLLLLSCPWTSEFGFWAFGF